VRNEGPRESAVDSMLGSTVGRLNKAMQILDESTGEGTMIRRVVKRISKNNGVTRQSYSRPSGL
jgi:hypothetical protein